MTNREFRFHLEDVRQAAHDARCARDALLAAEDSLTRIPRATTDSTFVRTGFTNGDRVAQRIHAYQTTKAQQATKLHECLHTLRAFRSELESADLNDLVCDALWLRHVCGMSFEQIGERLGLSTTTCWRLTRDGEVILGQSMGVTEPLKRRPHSPRYKLNS